MNVTFLMSNKHLYSQTQCQFKKIYLFFIRRWKCNLFFCLLKHKDTEEKISNMPLRYFRQIDQFTEDLLSSAGSESWGACSIECPQIAFVAWWNVTLMTEQGKWYHRCIFYPGCHCFTIQEESQTQRLTNTSVISPSKHSGVIVFSHL